MSTTTLHLPASKCPTCGYETNAATCIEQVELKLSPGDISLCLKCGEIGVFDENCIVREATVAELASMPPDTHREIERAQRLIRQQRPLG